MTIAELFIEINALLSTPLGTLLMVVLGGAVVYLRSRFTTSAKIDVAKAQLSTEHNANIAAIRSIALESQRRVIELEKNKGQLELERIGLEQQLQDALDMATSAKGEAESARRKADEVGAAHLRTVENLNKAQRQLEEREKENGQNRQEIGTLTKRLNNLEAERNDALALVEKRNGELKERDAALEAARAEIRQRDEQISGLRIALDQTKSQLDQTDSDLKEVRERLDNLEKHDTGALNPDKVTGTQSTIGEEKP